MTASTVNYQETFFEKKDLTKIRGKRTYETLQRLIKELKANASTVHSDLGGGNYDLLGLLLSPTSYALISTTLFVQPMHLGPLNIPVGTAQHAARTLKQQHNEEL